ncbi:MAG: hypothetical protein IPK59_07370 [Rhodospirillaceae bacterium]|nr:hypothetical protein [Rhodospirillaceae bacterium]
MLGVWENGVFRFNSPEAKETWDRESYEQGVNTDTWSFGKEIDAQSAGLAQAGLAGTAMPGLYRGPDGKYRLMNLKTIESQAARDHRNRDLKGMKLAQLESATTMPGVDEWVAKWKSAQAPANNNESDDSNNRAVRASTHYQSDATGESVLRLRPYEGRSGFRESTQGERDTARSLADAVMGDSIEEIRAGLTAAEALLNGGTFTETYDDERKKEETESQAIEERLGLLNPAIQLGVGLIPVVGDVSGAFADIKDWRANGEEWGLDDYGMALAGAATLTPGRKGLKSGKELIDGLVDKARPSLKGESDEALQSADNARKSDIDEEAADGAIKNPEQATFDPRSFFPKDENDILTKKQALDLPGEKVGLCWVAEPETHIPHAAAYEREGNGYVWSEKHNMPAKPSLRWDNPDGDDLVRFDNIDPTPQTTYLIVLVDSKADVPPSFWGAEITAAADVRRQVNAVRQNNKVIDGPKFKIRYELPDESRAQDMTALINRLGYGDEVIVQVREASQQAQDMFKKLRKKK